MLYYNVLHAVCCHGGRSVDELIYRQISAEPALSGSPDVNHSSAPYSKGLCHYS